MQQIKNLNATLLLVILSCLSLANISCKCGGKEEEGITPIDDKMIEVASMMNAPGGPFLSGVLKELQKTPSSDAINKTNSKDDEKTALHYAAELGVVKIITILIERKADPNKQTKEYKKTPLMVAVEMKRMAPLEALLKAPNIDPNIADEDGYTALHYVVHGNADLTILKKLLEVSGIDVNKKTKSGRTVLKMASTPAKQKYVDAIKAKGGTT